VPCIENCLYIHLVAEWPLSLWAEDDREVDRMREGAGQEID